MDPRTNPPAIAYGFSEDDEQGYCLLLILHQFVAA